ncbi:MAG: hypothetical protein ABFD49_06990 [Armatimonadota bacterium]|nr:hypothetical protein [bacterium]
MSSVLSFVTDNKDVLITFIVALVAVLKLTKWGKAKTTALDTIVGVIEKLGASSVKLSVATSMCSLTESVQDAITDAVAKADPKKTQSNIVVRFLRDLFKV